MSEKEKLEKKISNINQFQFSCFIPGIVMGLNNTKAIDADHARNAAILRLCTILLGLVICVVLQFVRASSKRRLRLLEAPMQSAQPPIPPPF